MYVMARIYVCGVGKEICMWWQGDIYVVARIYVCCGKEICMWWQGDMYVVARRYVCEYACMHVCLFSCCLKSQQHASVATVYTHRANQSHL